MYEEHRRRFLALLRDEGAAAVIPTASHKIRNHDCHYRFRPGSDFWYLTGFDEPGAVLVLLPELDSDGPGRAVLFMRERDPERETWDGRRLGLQAAPDALGIDEARPIEDLWEELPELLAGYETIVWRTGAEGEDDRRMLELLRTLRARARRGVSAPRALVDPASGLHELRLFKSPQELDCMRRAATISAKAHCAAMAAATPGLYEYEIEALIEGSFRRLGSSGPAYASIVAGGANACILHYVENRSLLEDGQLLLIDAGAEWDYYASDITRTFPVNGRFRAEQRALYEIVLDAQRVAIEAVMPGADFEAPHRAASQHIAGALVDLGWIEGSPEEAFEIGLHRPFTVHRTSHWLGLDVHDCGSTGSRDQPRKLEPGMVLTVEPGVYLAPEDERVEARWRGIGIRIEDDVLVTDSGYEVLSAEVPKEIEEVELACSRAALSPA